MHESGLDGGLPRGLLLIYKSDKRVCGCVRVCECEVV